ncbi:MAG: polysaccharide pyruvyl transferase family protein, partial [Caldilineaceae bacterium]|nr:polysaccharide pyruvyl transferase family protein [Caldilineaceae bacterium]
DHYCCSNTDDEAMLHGLISAVPLEQRRHVVVATRNHAAQSPLKAQGITLIPPAIQPVLRHLKNADGLVLGGGTHFHDDYVGLRYWRHYRYMARFVVLNLIARLMGKKVLWLGMGLGPFSRGTTRWLTQLGVALCDAVTVRESASLAEANQLNNASKVRLSFDLAALLQLDLSPVAERANILGISVMSMSNLKTDGSALNDHYLEHLSQTLDALLTADATLQVRIFLIRGGERESDVQMSTELYEQLHRQYRDRVRLVPYNSDPLIIAREIGACRAFMATRFHAALLSYLCGCRLLFLAYHRKVADLAGEIGLHPDAVLPMTTDLSTETLRNRLTRLVSAKDWYQPTLEVSEAVRRAQESIAIWREQEESLS